jgi:hypothetical protein
MTLPFEILPTDRRFEDSPDDGTPECLCSRCGQVIEEKCSPAIRAWPERGNYEYRYHPHCVGAWPCCQGDEEKDFDDGEPNGIPI